VRDSAQTCRQAPPTRSPAAFLTLRGGVFHFRRRLSKRLAGRTPTNELRRSLGTTSLAEAVKRAGALIAALERFEAFVMSDTVVTPLQSAEAKALIDELYRSEIAAMAAREALGGPRALEAADAERARLQSEREVGGAGAHGMIIAHQAFSLPHHRASLPCGCDPNVNAMQVDHRSRSPMRRSRE